MDEERLEQEFPEHTKAELVECSEDLAKVGENEGSGNA
jgi:hypothetical protein